MGELPPYFSVTQLTTYLGCPRKYLFRYVERRVAERRSAELALGSAVHSAIEWWMGERLQGREPTDEAVARLFRVDWHAQVAADEYDFEDKTPEAYKAVGEQLVALFVTRFRSEPPMRSEERFEVFVSDPRSGEPLPVPFIGIFDLVGDDSVGEIKTAAKKNGLDTYALQLSAYQYAHRQLTGRPARFRVIQLVKTKTPRIEVEEAEVGATDEDWFAEVAVAAYRSVSSGVAFHPNPSWMCGRCEFWGACRRAA